ncbi:MAG: 16S rRNA (adenine(1518)-N(6)/adenine(1519)-N(6))-dimethyltransferase RsmA [Candidatus Caldatribacterium sp.]|uniref:16S rRNA (adenine(1518)-N(6)/adenine(1519)-N(6))- dimethyltransferase RsmA n=1 Tax=Candidatus Caldatribacterium sp. TaxID=2282143 RepID=UPI0029996CA3|nr:16S rRNA (adenine(1518)-N(6)/adenine(1519)-N(6))-dimethyltransferase RsmA [Candidatus Caldatribacterium sp.]MCX7729734.1 16S rRNA (adenine(1518)-N(6)/adenine(1519)-N(6))-dimethyltransferase RsmA [Candidatus Caldatribacterium sp.]MDW8081156.1 16S rRNA (adenine(1518)-N(6)/adenine(1519)-N(6))-dimethyltransferase RsmA [Candidatus Calescibacterium sp.]
MRRGKLGQHFLVDRKVLERVVEAGELSRQDLVLEVGVGEGALTELLAQKAGWVVGLEVDPCLLTRAEQRLQGFANITLQKQDALEVDFGALLSPFPGTTRKCIANLPYGISKPFFLRLLESTQEVGWERFVVMVQYEFGEKLLSLPPQGKGNPLSVGVARIFSVERLLVIPPAAFRPRPKVYSLLLRGRRIPKVPEDFPEFLRFILWIFRFRRKTLKRLLPATVVPEKMGEKRAEDLTLEEWEKVWERVRVVLGKEQGYNGMGTGYAKEHLGW